MTETINGGKIVEKLLAFLGIDFGEVREKACIVAFRFVQED